VIEARLLASIRAGHQAASFELLEVGGSAEHAEGWRYRLLVDAQVECRVRYIGDAADRIVPLVELWRLADAGYAIEYVAPTTDALLWVAVAACPETLADGTPSGTVYATIARDNARGLAALVYSKAVQADGRKTGDRVAGWLQRSHVEGAAARVRRAGKRLSVDEARAATAVAAATHLQGEAARRDGGVPPIELRIVATDIKTGAQRDLVSIGDWPDSQASSKRRGRLHDAVLKELEQDAFGSRGNADRAFEPLDDTEYQALDSFEEDVEIQLDLAALIQGAGLTPRELEAFELMAQDKTYAEIAIAMKITEGTVSALLSTARRKLEKEARESFSEYRWSV
jgi:DNA-binding CsgD family transcriptional regulator